MRIFITIFIIIFTYHFANTKPAIDSLLSEFKLSKSDTAKVNLMISIAKHYSRGDVKLARDYNERSRNLAEKIGFRRGISAYYLVGGMIEANAGELMKAVDLTGKAIELAKDMKDSSMLADAYLNSGSNYLRLGNFDKAMESMMNSINVALNKKGTDYQIILGGNYMNLGNLYKAMKKFPEAIEYFNKSLDISRKINHQKFISSNYNNLANIFIETGENKKALDYLKESVKIDNMLGDMRGVAIDYHNIASVYYNLGKYDESLDWFSKSIEIKKSMGNNIGIATSYLGLADVFIALNKYENAIKTLERAREIFHSTNSTALMLNTFAVFHKVWLKMKKYDSAYKYLDFYYKLNDSLFNERKEKTIAEMNAKFNYSLKDKENEILRNESAVQNLIIIIIALVLGFVTVLVVLLIRKNSSFRKMNKLLSENKIRIEDQNKELEKINSMLSEVNNELKDLNTTKDKFFSIIAHDLINPINSSYKMIELLADSYDEFSEHDRKEVLVSIKKAFLGTFNLLENLLSWSRTQLNKITFTPDELYLKDFIGLTISQLIHIATEKKIIITNNIPDTARISTDPNMLTTIVRNLISNSIKYTPENGNISVSFDDSQSGFFFIKIIDTGVGMTPEIMENLFKIDKTNTLPGTSNEKGTGLGLVLCSEFISKMGGTISVDSEIRKGSTFTVSLPV